MKSVSAIFHPLLMATYVLVAFYLFMPDIFSPVALNSVPVVILATFLTTFIIPIISIAILKMTSRITNLELTNREERILPFLSIALFYAAATYMYFNKLHMQPPLSNMMITVTALITILLLITFRFKISIHAAASWGSVGLLIALNLKLANQTLMIPTLLFIVIAGLVSTSRLWLGSHTAKEIWAGTFLGFLFCFSGIFFFS